MTLSIYNIIWRVLRPVLPLVLGWRQQKGKEQAGRRQDRYGQPHFDSRLSDVIWLHSVSIGETIAAISLAKALAQTRPEAKFLITTNTVSAAELVHRETATGLPLFHAFQPLDHPLFVDRFLAKSCIADCCKIGPCNFCIVTIIDGSISTLDQKSIIGKVCFCRTATCACC